MSFEISQTKYQKTHLLLSFSTIMNTKGCKMLISRVSVIPAWVKPLNMVAIPGDSFSET